jgi:hypothetical protein
MTRRNLLLLSLAPSAAALAADDNRAVIMVTGMRLRRGPSGETRDLTVAEGATVTVTAKQGAPVRKKTVLLAEAGRRRENFFTADFPVALDGVYEIVMTFRDGAAVRVSDYRLPSNWKTHFLFHNTRGTKSPASILRREKEAAGDRACLVYALWPVAAYEQLTERTVPPVHPGPE